MTTITLHLHAVADQLPDADTDVLIFDASSDEAQLGALNWTDPIEWVDAQGAPVEGVTHWAEMPRRTR